MADLELFRTQITTWLEANCPAEMRTPAKSDDEICWGGRKWVFQSEAQKTWLNACVEKGYTVPDWPVEYGGAGLSAAQTKILRSEMARLGCRSPLNSFGIWMLGPALLKFGSEAQKLHYLPPIARGEIRWCQGYSEPGSGSDLVSIQTYGEEVIDPMAGDHWIVNGQKVWTSYADKADWIFCLVRTDKTNKYQGISFLLFDMETPGVTTKPIKLISGYSPFCETFFDNVPVPKHQIVGEPNRGWDVAKYLLGHEREMISAMGSDGGTASLGAGFKDVLSDEPVLRAQMALFDVESLSFRAHSERFMDEWKAGTGHPAYSNLMKYVGTELNKRRHELVMSSGGSDALEWDSDRSNAGDRPRAWLRTKANSIEGGTSEIMLNVVAKRILEMPGV
jgi:acyl-CoA dehydrogenase